MSTEKCPALPQNRLCSEMLLPLDQKTPFAMNPLKAGVLVGGGGRLNIFPSGMKTRYFHSFKAAYKLLQFVFKLTEKNNHISLPAKSSTVHCLKDSM